MIIDGNKIAEDIYDKLKIQVKENNLKLRLALVMVGENPSSRKFLELKKKAAEAIGIEAKIYYFPTTLTTRKLREEIVKLAKVKNINGIVIELPLPDGINTQSVLNAISEEKDVDVLSQKAQGSFFLGRSKILPPAVEAIKIVFKKHIIEFKGKTCAIFGYGLLVGKPIAYWLMAQGVTVTVINEHTPEPERYSRLADIVISGVGKPGLIKDDMIKEKAVVIDFGYQQSDRGVVGDVDYESVRKKTRLITPVPGGVGPIVVAAVMKNLITIYEA